MENRNRIQELFNIQYPIVQGGMVWCSGWKLASAVSNAGGLGLIGAGSMYPEILIEHIQKCRKVCDKPFGVNVPLLYPYAAEHIRNIIDLGVKIVFTSAGNPKTFTEDLKKSGITVVHVVSSSVFAQKAEAAGVDAVVAEGFEAGGHNGREETTTLCLIPRVVSQVSVPVMAAGGISSGKSMAAVFALGAEGVQLGSRFAACAESSAHQNYKEWVRNCREGDTILTLKELTPVRMIKNRFCLEIETAIKSGAGADELRNILGKGRTRIGIFEGDTENGELEIGQVSALIHQEETAAEIIKELIAEYNDCVKKLNNQRF